MPQKALKKGSKKIQKASKGAKKKEFRKGRNALTV